MLARDGLYVGFVVGRRHRVLGCTIAFVVHKNVSRQPATRLSEISKEGESYGRVLLNCFLGNFVEEASRALGPVRIPQVVFYIGPWGVTRTYCVAVHRSGRDVCRRAR